MPQLPKLARHDWTSEQLGAKADASDLGNAAGLDVGTTAGTVMAADDARVTSLSSTYARYVVLTQAEYDAIPVPDPYTFYWISDGVDSSADLTAIAAVLVGGAAGQYLAKVSGTDYDFAWSASTTPDPTADVLQWTMEDFVGATTVTSTRFAGSSAIATGTATTSVGAVNHPGQFAVRSHASNANSGFRIATTSNSIILGGGERGIVVFKTAATLAGVTTRVGFSDTIDHTAPPDSVTVTIQGDTLTGNTSSNSTPSTTATSYTVTAATWYRLVVELDAAATLATFTLYADDSDTVLWTHTLATTIPTGAGRTTGFAYIATLDTPGAATELGFVDLMALYLPQRKVI